MTTYLLDTNHVTRVMGSPDQLNSLITRQTQAGDRFTISITVLGELFFAAYASTRKERNLKNLENLLMHIPVLEFGMAAAEEYGRIKAELRAIGRPIPGTDAQIAAVARQHDLTVLSSDRHFSYIQNLTVESWF